MEHVEESPFLSSCRIECSLDRNNIFRVVGLVIGENHQLRNIQERAEGLVPEAGVDSFSFSEHPVTVVGFLDLDEGQGDAIHKAGDIGTETVVGLWILAGEFGCAMPMVSRWFVEVDEADTACGRQFMVECPSEVVVLGGLYDFRQAKVYLILADAWIYLRDGFSEHRDKNVGTWFEIILVYMVDICVSQPMKVNSRRDLNACVFIESFAHFPASPIFRALICCLDLSPFALWLEIQISIFSCLEIYSFPIGHIKVFTGIMYLYVALDVRS